MTLSEAAEVLGCSTANLRMQIASGQIKAERRSFGWLVEDSEVQRYSRESLGKKGRAGKPKDNK